MNTGTTQPPTGLRRIAAAFDRARTQGRPALMPYFTAGFPDLKTSEAVFRAVAEAGADLIELGVPFSDPLADGPTIQHSTQTALAQGITPAHCLKLVARLRTQAVTQPIMLMGYVNPILAYGVVRYVADAAAAGADGLIVPDLPVEEADEIESACEAAGLALTYLAAPTSTPARLKELARRTTGFLYLVSLTGVTGARSALPEGLADFTARARRVATTPLAIGFGISRPEHVRAAGALADGVIVGSALIRAVAEANDPIGAAAAFLRALRQPPEKADFPTDAEAGNPE